MIKNKGVAVSAMITALLGGEASAADASSSKLEASW